MDEPGLDLHDWETRYSALEEELATDPRGALPELYRLLERMLEERGYHVGDSLAEEVAREGDDPEVILDFAAAEEVVLALEHGEDVDPSDVGQAIANLRELHDFLVAEHAPGDSTVL